MNMNLSPGWLPLENGKESGAAPLTFASFHWHWVMGYAGYGPGAGGRGPDRGVRRRRFSVLVGGYLFSTTDRDSDCGATGWPRSHALIA
jgi:hypothetical protein